MLLYNAPKFLSLKSFLVFMSSTVVARLAQDAIPHNEIRAISNTSDETVLRKIEKCPCKINYQNAQSYIHKLESKINYDRRRFEEDKINLLYQMKHLQKEIRSVESKFDYLMKEKMLKTSPEKVAILPSKKNDEIEQFKRALYDEWIKYIEEWHPVNSMTNANPSKSIELDKKIGLANHIILKPYSKFSRFANTRKSDKPKTHTKPKSSIPKFSDNRNTSKPAFPLKRKITQLNQPIRKNTQRHRFPNRRQTTALASNSLFRSFVAISGLLNVVNSVRHEFAIRSLISRLEKDETSITSTEERVENMVSSVISMLEERVSASETLALNTGFSLEAICIVIDSATYHCCVNAQANKMYCAEQALANALKIDTSNGANTCDKSNNALVCLPD